MSRHSLIFENASINTLPKPHPRPGTSQITIGDLHGNVLNLIWQLYAAGVLTISAEHYAELVTLYAIDANEITQEQFARVIELIRSVQVVKSTADDDNPVELLLRLIGDEMSDRGSNDFYTLTLLDTLKKQGVNLEILASNHGADFICSYEKFKNDSGFCTDSAVVALASQRASLTNMNTLLQRGLVSKDAIFSLIDDVYKPSLVFYSYSYDAKEDVFTFFSHAPIDLPDVQNLAVQFGTGFGYRSPEELAVSINEVNEAYRKIISQEKFHQIYELPKSFFQYRYGLPVYYSLWNRDYNNLGRKNYPFEIYFVHGHDSPDPDLLALSLDTNFAKFSGDAGDGKVIILLSDEPSFRPQLTTKLKAAVPYECVWEGGCSKKIDTKTAKSIIQQSGREPLKPRRPPPLPPLLPRAELTLPPPVPQLPAAFNDGKQQQLLSVKSELTTVVFAGLFLTNMNDDDDVYFGDQISPTPGSN